jgi:trigger factor
MLTNEKYEEAVSELLSSEQYYEQITDRAAQEGDTVNVDFKGFMDGVQFEGGTAQDQTVPITESSGYIEGFAEGIIGAKAGETVTVNLNFPEDYYEDIAGKAVTFEITVNYIQGELITPKMNDEFVSKYTDGEYKTVAEFEAYYRTVLQESYEETAKSDAISAMWDKVIELCEVIEYPEQQVTYYYEQQISQCEYYAQSYGMTVEQVMSIMGWTEEVLMENARLYTKGDLVFNAISQKENIGISEEEYLTGLAKYAESAGTTSAVLEAYYGKDYIMENLLWDKVLVSIYDRATVTRVEE